MPNFIYELSESFSGKVPYLEVDGKVLVESMAIARYVAREGGLLGKSSFEEAVVDSAVEVVTNMYLKFISTKFAPEGHKVSLRLFIYILNLSNKFILYILTNIYFLIVRKQPNKNLQKSTLFMLLISSKSFWETKSFW